MKKILELYGLIKNLVKLWPEFWSVPMGLLLWVLSPIFLRWIDPYAGVFDSGVLQNAAYAIILLLLFNGAAFLGIKINFPSVFRFYEKGFYTDNNELTEWQKTKLLLCLFFGYLLAFVALAASL